MMPEVLFCFFLLSTKTVQRGKHSDDSAFWFILIMLSRLSFSIFFSSAQIQMSANHPNLKLHSQNFH